MRELVGHLHANDQSYIVMVDPAVAYQPYPPFERGVKDHLENGASRLRGRVSRVRIRASPMFPQSPKNIFNIND